MHHAFLLALLLMCLFTSCEPTIDNRAISLTPIDSFTFRIEDKRALLFFDLWTKDKLITWEDNKKFIIYRKNKNKEYQWFAEKSISALPHSIYSMSVQPNKHILLLDRKHPNVYEFDTNFLLVRKIELRDHLPIYGSRYKLESVHLYPATIHDSILSVVTFSAISIHLIKDPYNEIVPVNFYNLNSHQFFSPNPIHEPLVNQTRYSTVPLLSTYNEETTIIFPYTDTIFRFSMLTRKLIRIPINNPKYSLAPEFTMKPAEDGYWEKLQSVTYGSFEYIYQTNLSNGCTLAAFKLPRKLNDSLKTGLIKIDKIGNIIATYTLQNDLYPNVATVKLSENRLALKVPTKGSLSTEQIAKYYVFQF